MSEIRLGAMPERPVLPVLCIPSFALVTRGARVCSPGFIGTHGVDAAFPTASAL